MNYILYLAHGNSGYINECRFSLLNYLFVYNLQPPVNTSVVIYTDKAALFEAFIPFFNQFHIEEITSATIQSWIDGTGYVHRAKTKCVQDFFRKYDGNVIFFDTDTFIIKPIDDLWKNISNGTIYMHTLEGEIGKEVNPVFKKWNRYLRNANINFGDETFRYSENLKIWNSGVLGLSSSYASSLEKIILLMDEIYKQFPKHIAEQVATSYYFQNNDIRAAEQSVFHYWNLKEMRVVFEDFFKKYEEESIPNLVKLIHTIKVETIQREKLQYEQLPSFKRLLAKLTGKDWRIGKYLNKL